VRIAVSPAAAMGLAACCMMAYWCMHGLEAWAGQRYKRAVATAPRALLLVGHKLNLRTGGVMAKGHPTLMLVASDTCAGARREVLIWRQTIEAIGRQCRPHLLLVGLGSASLVEPLAHLARRNGWTHETVVVPDTGLPEYGLRTGIHSVPYTIVLGPDMRVRLIVPSMNEKAVAMIRRSVEASAIDRDGGRVL